MWLLALALNAWAACPDEKITADAIEEHLGAAYAAYSAQDVDGYVQTYASLAQHVACLDEVLSADGAADLLLFQGVHAALMGDPERARNMFFGARHVRSDLALPATVEQLGGDPVAVFSELGEQPETQVKALPDAPRATFYVNGTAARERPVDLPAVVQVQAPDSRVVWTALLPGSGGLPDWVVAGEIETDVSRGLLDATGYRMVRVEPGTFAMGAPREQPGRDRDSDETEHEVTISRPFLLGATEVTQELWEAAMGSNPSRYVVQGRPVEQVSWMDAVRFCNRLSRLEGLPEVYAIEDEDHVVWDRSATGYRLPTEAEWEYAARAGLRTRYSGSDKPDEVAWWGLGGGGRTHVVGQLKANAFGLYDMSGNVYEWVWDWHAPFPSTPQTDPVGPGTGKYRVYRGGAHTNGRRDLRLGDRKTGGPSMTKPWIGFRIARSIE